MKLKSVLVGGFVCLASFAAASPIMAEDAGIGPSFKGPVGLQLYSLREQFAKDVPGTLDEVRDFGFKNVELASTYKMPPEKLKAELESRGLEGDQRSLSV